MPGTEAVPELTVVVPVFRNATRIAELSARLDRAITRHSYEVLFVDEKALTVDLPSTVALKVIESSEGVKGDTASNVQKPAKLETGLVVGVPPFIDAGETIRVDTSEGTYLERVNK